MDLKQVVNRIADLIENRQKKLAPYKTGALRRSIKTFVTYGRNLITISSQMKDYGYFQDSGVSGNVKKVRDNTPESFYPPGEFKKRVSGFEPQPFINKATLPVMDKIGNRLLGESIANNILLKFKKLSTKKEL